jgi:hypothetical protein
MLYRKTSAPGVSLSPLAPKWGRPLLSLLYVFITVNEGARCLHLYDPVRGGPPKRVYGFSVGWSCHNPDWLQSYLLKFFHFKTCFSSLFVLVRPFLS